MGLEALANLDPAVIVIGGISVIGAMLGGGVVTVAGIRMEWPGIKKLKNRIFTDNMIFEQLSRYHSYHAVTVVLTIKKAGTVNAEIRASSNKASRFYGYSDEREPLTGHSTAELLSRLAQWMDPQDFKEFSEDQSRVFTDYNNGGEAHAKVPIKFNDKHPNDDFKNKAFLPIIVKFSGSKKVKDEREEELITVLYLDVGKVPKHQRPIPAVT